MTTPFRKCAALAAAIACSIGPALAQEVTTVQVSRGLLKDQPFTVIYPDFMKPGVGSADAAMHLTFPEHTIQCELFITKASAPKTVDQALSEFDKAATEATWKETFPNFKLLDAGKTDFQNGNALLYVGQTGDNPNGPPFNLYRAETIDGGRLYAYECLVGSSEADYLEGLVSFLFLNFSTTSDGKCCTDPSKPR